MKIKIILVSIALACTATLAAAGTKTGLAVGAVAGYAVGKFSSSSRVVGANQVEYISDIPGRDVIVCRTTSGTNCAAHVCANNKDCTPAQFAKQNGYNWIYKRSAVITHEQQYIVMEVSNIPPQQQK